MCVGRYGVSAYDIIKNVNACVHFMTKNINKSDIQKLIEEAEYFFDVDGLWHASKNQDYKKYGDDTYRLEDFAVLDVKLPLVFKTLAALKRADSPHIAPTYFPAVAVRETLAFWENPKFLLRKDGHLVAYGALDFFMKEDSSFGSDEVALMIYRYDF